jgi:uncharacterized protein YvpB
VSFAIILIAGSITVGYGEGANKKNYYTETNPQNNHKQIPVTFEPDTKILDYDTEQISVRLDVPYFKQEFKQSCEAASLRMALAYRDIDTNDTALMKLFGYNFDSSPKKRDLSNNVWDDPYVSFVGDVHGLQAKGEGYGIYAPAVAKVGPEVGRQLLAIENVSAAQIAAYIYNGNPVIVWGYLDNTSSKDSWKTAEGKVVPAVMKAHVRLAYGVAGPAANPTGFYVHDPSEPAKRPVLWPTDKFMDNLKKFDKASDQAVVVF